jgi:hypothetical protein
VKQIPLSRGKFATVDDEDFEKLSKYNWYCNNYGYAVRGRRHADGVLPRCILMHREIMNTPIGMCVDHIDGDGVNNRKTNLRNCTRSSNGAHIIRKPRSSSGFYGVHWDINNNNWRVLIKFNGASIHIGRFSDLQEAVCARDVAATKLFGEFATLNFTNRGMVTKP